MTRDDETCLKLGREVVRMIHDIRKVTGGEAGYARRRFTHPGGEIHLLLANSAELADLMDTAASGRYDVKTVAPPSQRN